MVSFVAFQTNERKKNTFLTLVHLSFWISEQVDNNMFALEWVRIELEVEIVWLRWLATKKQNSISTRNTHDTVQKYGNASTRNYVHFYLYSIWLSFNQKSSHITSAVLCLSTNGFNPPIFVISYIRYLIITVISCPTRPKMQTQMNINNTSLVKRSKREWRQINNIIDD